MISADDEFAVSGAVAAAGDTRVARLGAAREPLVRPGRRRSGPWRGRAVGPFEILEPASGWLGFPQPRVAGSASGDALAARVTDDRGLRAAAFTPAGGWGAPVTIAPAVVTQPLSIALASDGTAVAAWWERTDASVALRAVLRGPDGAWGAPATLSRPLPLLRALPSEPPHASVRAGEGLVVWSQSDPTSRGSIYAARLGPEGPRGSWRLSTLEGGAGAEGGLDAAGRATVVWSQFRGHHFELSWVGQVAGGRWTAPRTIPTTGASCEARLAPRLGVAPDGVAHVIWTQGHRRGLVVMAAARRPGQGFAQPSAISRADASPAAALAVSEAGVLAGWSRASPADRPRAFIEAAISDPPAAARGLIQFAAPRLDRVLTPSRIALRESVPIRFRLSHAARVEVRFKRIRPSTRFVGPFRRGGRAGANAIEVPTWVGFRRRLGPGVYEMYVGAMTAERASCTITRRLVVRG